MGSAWSAAPATDTTQPSQRPGLELPEPVSRERRRNVLEVGPTLCVRVLIPSAPALYGNPMASTDQIGAHTQEHKEYIERVR